MPNADVYSSPRSHAAVAPKLPRAMPRLADFHFANSAGLISRSILAAGVRAAEFVMVSASGLAIALTYVMPADPAAADLYLVTAIGAGFLAVALMQAAGLYHTKAISNAAKQIPAALTAWTITLAILVAVLFFFKAGSEVSRIWLMSWFLAGATSLIATRSTLSIFVRKWAREGRLNKRAIIYGSGPEGEALLRTLEADPETDIRICGVFDERDGDRSSRETAGYPKLGSLNDLVEFVRHTRIDLVILSMPLSAEQRLIQILGKLSVLPVDIRLASTASKLRLNPRTYSYIGNVAMIDLIDKPINEWGSVAKSIFDRTIGLAALILLAPLMLAVAAAIRLDSKGPVFFRQKRYGFNNELIEIFKFRSMYVDMTDAQAARLVTKDDPRVTPIGRFIRKTSIDELPQLFNVLLGDLSLVGPRPHALQAKAADKLYDTAVDNYFARHKVKPGITGWAQINGWRGETDTEEKLRKRVEHDLYYIDNWSLFFDFYILLKTPLALVKTDNAY